MVETAHKKFYSLLFYFLVALTNSALAENEIPPAFSTPAEATRTPQDKIFQTRVLAQLDAFSILLHKIGVRAKGLSLSTEEHDRLRHELYDMQENLKVIKARNTLHVERTQLVKLTILLNALIKATETSVKLSLKVVPQPDARALKRSPKSMEPEELEDLLLENEKLLKGFDRHIANMDKSIVNRSYTWFSDKWNTPILSITSLGGESNKDIFISSVLKRIGFYGAGLGLVIYNLPKKYIANIPNKRLRAWIEGLKHLVGDAPYLEQTTKKERAHQVEFLNPDGENYLGNMGGNAHKLRSEPNGTPYVTQGQLSEQKVNFEDGSSITIELPTQIKVPVILNNGRYKLGRNYPDNTEFSLHLAGSGDSAIKFTDAEKFLSNVFYNGDAYQLPSGGYVAESGKGSFQDLVTGNRIQVSVDDLADAHKIQRGATVDSKYAWFDRATGEQISVDKDLIVNKGHEGYATGTEASKKSEQFPPGGLINNLFGNIRWLLPPELSSIGFQLPVAKYVSNQIYDDIKTVSQDIPQVVAYLHTKLRGEKEELIGNYLVPKETFDDVVGREEIKSQLRPIIDFVSNPQGHIQSGIQLPRGYLLAGEPQTGKTLMVKALAGELSKVIKETQGSGKEVKVFPIEVHRLIRDGIGPWMNLLRQCAPCILFCDEFDLTGAQRSENKLFLAEALTALSGYTTSSDLQDLVIFVIATNRPENIDYAIVDPGRCGNVLYFENPYFKDRKNYFARFFKNRMINTEAFDLDEIAQETEACSYAILQSIGHGILGLAEKHNQIPCQRHAQEVLDTVVRKIIYEGDEVAEIKRQVMAARYGAKAFASVILNPEKKFVAATLQKITKKIEEKPVLHHYEVVNDKSTSGVQFGGIFSYNQTDTYGLVSDEELVKECKIALAGTVGQRVLNLEYTSYPEDEMEAIKIARRLMFHGCPENTFPRKIREEKSTEAYLLVEKCRQEMYDLLYENRTNFEKLVDLLQHRKVIRTSDVKQCFDLDDLDLVRDYFVHKRSPVVPPTNRQEDEDDLLLLDEVDEEEEKMERQEATARIERLRAYQEKRKREFEAAEAELEHEHTENCDH